MGDHAGRSLSSPEGANFYPPIIADPNPAIGRSIFQGSGAERLAVAELGRGP